MLEEASKSRFGSFILTIIFSPLLLGLVLGFIHFVAFVFELDFQIVDFLGIEDTPDYLRLSIYCWLIVFVVPWIPPWLYNSIKDFRKQKN